MSNEIMRKALSTTKIHSVMGRKLLCKLCELSDKDGNVKQISLQDLSDELLMTLQTVKNHLLRLRDKDLISYRKIPGKTNQYKVLLDNLTESVETKIVELAKQDLRVAGYSRRQVYLAIARANKKGLSKVSRDDIAQAVFKEAGTAGKIIKDLVDLGVITKLEKNIYKFNFPTTNKNYCWY